MTLTQHCSMKLYDLIHLYGMERLSWNFIDSIYPHIRSKHDLDTQQKVRYWFFQIKSIWYDDDEDYNDCCHPCNKSYRIVLFYWSIAFWFLFLSNRIELESFTYNVVIRIFYAVSRSQQTLCNAVPISKRREDRTK